MKYLLILFISLISLPSVAQQLSYQEWQEEAKTNITLQPEYGHVLKTNEQIKADNDFIALCLKSDTTHRKASEHLVSLGFTYLSRGDQKTAMSRFNLAWLLDPTNENVYWGFGAIYGGFNDYPAAIVQYDKGLAINPNSTNILTDKATIYMMTFQQGGDAANLKTALELFKKSYALDALNQNTLYKLSITYFLGDDCKNALLYYNECKKLGGNPIGDNYTQALLAKCHK